MSDKEMLTLFENVLDELGTAFNQYLNQGHPIGHIFFVPVQTDRGFEIGPNSPQEIVPLWMNSIEAVFGRELENLKSLGELQNKLAEFYSSDFPPPRLSFGPDLNHEIKLLLSDFLGASKLRDGLLEFPQEPKLTDLAYDFLRRKSDVYYAKSPLFGVRVGQKISFSFGEILPLSWNDRVDLLKSQSLRQFNAFDHMHINRVLNTEALLLVSYEKMRKKADALIFPAEIQYLTHNAVQLLRAYDYGYIQILGTEIYLEPISKRVCGTSYSSVENTIPLPSDIYSINDISTFKSFMNKFLKNEHFEERELSLIFNRLNEAWLRGRTFNFRVFDYVSILEALLVAENEGEFRFKVSVLAAAFSGKNSVNKKELFKLVKKAYNVRSKVAHCAKAILPKEQLTPDELKTLGKITHPIIRYAMEYGPKKLKEEAEDKLLC